MAGDQSLICLVDDEQWLDQASGADAEVRSATTGRRAGRPAAARGDHGNDYERRLVNDTAARIYCASLRQGF